MSDVSSDVCSSYVLGSQGVVDAARPWDRAPRVDVLEGGDVGRHRVHAGADTVHIVAPVTTDAAMDIPGERLEPQHWSGAAVRAQSRRQRLQPQRGGQPGHDDEGEDRQFPRLRIAQHAAELVAEQGDHQDAGRSEEHTSELQSLMRLSYAVLCMKK